MNGTIGAWVGKLAVSVVAEKKLASRAAASMGKDKIGGIGDDAEDHVAGVKTEGCIRMSGQVVEKHVACFGGFFSWTGLAVRDFVQGNKDCLIDRTAVVEEEARDGLDTFDAGLVEQGREIGVGELDFAAIDRSGPEVGGMLGTGGLSVAEFG